MFTWPSLGHLGDADAVLRAVEDRVELADEDIALAAPQGNGVRCEAIRAIMLEDGLDLLHGL